MCTISAYQITHCSLTCAMISEVAKFVWFQRIEAPLCPLICVLASNPWTMYLSHVHDESRMWVFTMDLKLVSMHVGNDAILMRCIIFHKTSWRNSERIACWRTTAKTPSHYWAAIAASNTINKLHKKVQIKEFSREMGLQKRIQTWRGRGWLWNVAKGAVCELEGT
jgi:hypothetical protein